MKNSGCGRLGMMETETLWQALNKRPKDEANPQKQFYDKIKVHFQTNLEYISLSSKKEKT